MSIGTKINKSSRYILPPWPLQDITWIYHILLLAKHLITYWCKTWADCYRDNTIMTTTKNIFVNIVCMAASVKCNKESSFQNLTTREDVTKLSLQKPNTSCVYLLSTTRISKVFHVNKTLVCHDHQNPSPPNTSNTDHVEAASTLNAVMDNTLKHSK